MNRSVRENFRFRVRGGGFVSGCVGQTDSVITGVIVISLVTIATKAFAMREPKVTL